MTIRAIEIGSTAATLQLIKPLTVTEKELLDPNACNESDGRIAQKDSRQSESSGKADLTIWDDLLIARTDFTAPVQLWGILYLKLNRVTHNFLHNLYSSPSIIRMIKSRRMR
jgi:hypothetical protein